MNAVSLGMLLALCNTVVIAVAMDLSVTVRGVSVAGNVFIVAFLPALALGAVLGAAAGICERSSVWARLAMLATPAVALVAVLGALFDMHAYVLPACMPTLAAIGMLERYTRRPMLPAARMR